MMAVILCDKIRQKPQQCSNTLGHGQSNETRSTMSILTFDSGKHYLGKLCSRNHDWEGSKASLRRIASKACLECECVNSRKYRASNPEKALESVDKYRKANPEVVVNQREAYRASGKSAQKSKQWRENHPEYLQAHAERERLRRFKKRASNQEGYTIEQVRTRFSEFNNCCAYCKSEENLTMDHFIAIKNDGSDCLDNLVPACFSCNSSKSSSNAFEWYSKKEFYSQEQWDFILSILMKDDKNGFLKWLYPVN
jgi:5-methylcytosine-specific restriction endonuclease McrA